MSPTNDKRIVELDGLRAIAVYMVILYHFTVFWSPAGRGDPLLAYGDQLAWVPFAAVGFLGVSLFFIISGFVILLTLQRSEGIGGFLLRRIIRLWPSLALFGTVTFIVVSIFGPESLRVGPLDYLISLFALPPQHVAPLFGQQTGAWIDGAYWSLFVEVRFYVMIAIVYFLSPRNIIRNWFWVNAALIVLFLAKELTGDPLLDKLDGLLIQEAAPFFSFGMASYCIFVGRRDPWVLRLAALSLAHAVGVTLYTKLAFDPWRDAQLALGLFGVFWIIHRLTWRAAPTPALSAPALQATGRASYGLYLVHQNVGLTVLSLGVFGGGPAAAALGLAAVTLGLTVVALAAHAYFDEPVQAWLRARLLRGAARAPRGPVTTPPGLFRAPGGSGATRSAAQPQRAARAPTPAIRRRSDPVD